jgi:WD40 repeat protein
MAPEQAAGRSKEIGPAVDVYALGAVLYELLTGRPPFRAPTTLDTLLQVETEQPVPPSRLQPGVPRDLETVCLKCLHKDPARCYGSAEALGDDLRRFLADEPIRARPVRVWERAAKWARRHPARAALAAMSLLAAGGMAAVGIGLHVNASLADANARLERSLESEKEARANAARQRAEVRRLLYVADMHHANEAWQAKQIGRAIRLLDAHRPRPGEEDLRGFEWHYLWQALRGARLTLTGHDGAISTMAYSPDGKRLATAGADKAVIVWDADTGKELLTLRGHTCELCGVSFSPDGKHLVSAGVKRPVSIRDRGLGEVKVWDLATGQEESAWQSPVGIRAVALSAGGDRVVLAGSDEVARLCDVSTGREVCSFGGHKGVTSIAFYGDGKNLVSAGGGVVKVWRAADGREAHTFTLLDDSITKSETFSPDGKRFAVAKILPGGAPPVVRIWDVTTGRQTLTFKAYSDASHRMVFSSDGKLLAATGEGHAVQIWDAATGRDLFTLHGHKETLQALTFSPDGQWLASAAGNDELTDRPGEVKVWHLSPAREPLTLACSGGHSSVTFSSDGRWLASIGKAGINTVTVWDAASGKVIRTLVAPEGMDFVTGYTSDGSVALSPNGRWLAAAGIRGAMVWDMASGESVMTWAEHDYPCRVWFSPDSRRVALGCADGFLVWDITAKQETYRFGFPREAGQWCASAVFSPDGQRVAAGAAGGSVTICDLASGRQLLTLTCPFMLQAWAYSPDGRRLAAACSPTQEDTDAIRIFDVRTGKELLTLGGDEGVTTVAYSPDGLRLVSANRDGTVRLWDAQTGQELLTIRELAKEEFAMSAVFSLDGRRLAANGGAIIKVWGPMPP